MNMFASVILTSLLSLLLSVWAPVSPQSSADTPIPNTSSHTTRTAKPTKNSTIKLAHAPIGTTTLSSGDQGGTVITITLTGLAPKSSHTAFLQSGTCKQNNGQVVSILKNVVANAAGGAKSTTALTSLPDKNNSWSVVVQNGINTLQTDPNMQTNPNDPNMQTDPNDPTMQTDPNDPNSISNDPNGNGTTPNDPNTRTALEQRAISCGDAPATNNRSNTPVRIMMKGTIAPNENAKGTVSFKTAKSKNGTSALTVSIVLTGLEPNSSHVAHIHTGSCRAQGAVLAMLTNVRADGRGRGTSKTTITSATELKALSTAKALYVNVHTGSTMQQLAQAIYFNPIACGDLQQKNQSKVTNQGKTTTQKLKA